MSIIGAVANFLEENWYPTPAAAVAPDETRRRRRPRRNLFQLVCFGLGPLLVAYGAVVVAYVISTPVPAGTIFWMIFRFQGLFIGAPTPAVCPPLPPLSARCSALCNAGEFPCGPDACTFRCHPGLPQRHGRRMSNFLTCLVAQGCPCPGSGCAVARRRTKMRACGAPCSGTCCRAVASLILPISILTTRPWVSASRMRLRVASREARYLWQPRYGHRTTARSLRRHGMPSQPGCGDARLSARACANMSISEMFVLLTNPSRQAKGHVEGSGS